MAGLLNKLKDSIVGDTSEKNSSSSSFSTGANTSNSGTNITHGDDMGRGVAHPGTGIGTNTTSTPLFGDKDRDNHDGHAENADLARYEQRHGHTHGLDVVEERQGGTTGLGSSTTGTGLGSSTTGTGVGSTTGTGLGSTTGTSAHTSGSGVGYGQNTSRGLGNTSSDYDQTTGGTGYGQNTTGTGYGQNTTGTGSGLTSSSTTGTNTTGTTGTSGGLLNKLNPFSSNDTTNTGTSGSGLTGNNTTGSGLTGTSSTGGYETHYPGLHSGDVVSELKGEALGEAGVHHRHNLYMSDKIEDYQQGSGRHTTGDPNYGLSSLGNRTGTEGQIGSEYGNTGTTGSTGYGGTTTSGPHNSNVANKVDPRVDSDNDGSRLR